MHRSLVIVTICALALLLHSSGPVGASPTAPSRATQGSDFQAESLEASLVQFGNELAQMVRAGEFDAVLDRWEPEAVTCPQEFSPDVCQGVADGQVAQGYPINIFYSELPVRPAEQAIDALESLRAGLSGPDIRVFTIGMAGADGSSCANCLVVLSTADAAAGSGAALQVMAFWLSDETGELMVQYVIGGEISPTRDLPLIEGGEWRSYTMIPVEGRPPAAPNTGSGLAASTESDLGWLFVVLLGGLAMSASVIGFTAIRRPTAAPRPADTSCKSS